MRRILVVLLALAFGLTMMTAANAGVKKWTDPRGGDLSYLDMYSASVGNTADGVRIGFRIHTVDWAEFSPSGNLRALIDTGGTRGPEFLFELGIPGDGGLRALKGTRAWKRKWRQDPVARFCGRTFRPHYDLENGAFRLLIRPKRGCLFHPKRVRIYLLTVEHGYYKNPNYEGYTKNTPPLYDYLPAAHTYTPWVKYSRR